MGIGLRYKICNPYRVYNNYCNFLYASIFKGDVKNEDVIRYSELAVPRIKYCEIQSKYCKNVISFSIDKTPIVLLELKVKV